MSFSDPLKKKYPVFLLMDSNYCYVQNVEFPVMSKRGKKKTKKTMCTFLKNYKKKIRLKGFRGQYKC